MDDTFGKYSEYMAIGYAAMAVVLFAMIAWMYLRYVTLRRQEAEIAQLEQEIAAERAQSASKPQSTPAMVRAVEDA